MQPAAYRSEIMHLDIEAGMDSILELRRLQLPYTPRPMNGKCSFPVAACSPDARLMLDEWVSLAK